MDRSITIVPFLPNYLMQVKDVVGKGLLDTGVIEPSEFPITDEDLDKIPEIYSGKGNFWIALRGETVIGTVAIKDMGNSTAKLKRMFILKEYYGSGLGVALLSTAINFAKEQGFNELILNSHVRMKRAHHFYEKNGFERMANTEDACAVHFRMRLTESSRSLS